MCVKEVQEQPHELSILLNF